LTKSEIPKPKTFETAKTFSRKISGWLKGIIQNIKTKEEALAEKDKELNSKKK